jgi:hypothetical protein
MALKSATSSTKSDRGVKAFVTFRVAGERLSPDEVTNLLKVTPTHAHRRGEPHSTGRSTVVGKTGVWLFSTDRIMLGGNLYDHLGLIFTILGLSRPSAIEFSSENGEFSRIARFLRLKKFLEEHSLTATLTLFWHGPQSVAYPKIPDELVELSELVPIKVESDFDKDEESRRKAPRAA